MTLAPAPPVQGSPYMDIYNILMYSELYNQCSLLD